MLYVPSAAVLSSTACCRATMAPHCLGHNTIPNNASPASLSFDKDRNNISALAISKKSMSTFMPAAIIEYFVLEEPRVLNVWTIDQTEWRMMTTETTKTMPGGLKTNDDRSGLRAPRYMLKRRNSKPLSAAHNARNISVALKTPAPN